MAKIILKAPATPYETTIDTEVMDIEIRGAFIGVRFVSEDGRVLSVSERDGYFEVVRGGVSNDSRAKDSANGC